MLWKSPVQGPWVPCRPKHMSGPRHWHCFGIHNTLSSSEWEQGQGEPDPTSSNPQTPCLSCRLGRAACYLPTTHSCGRHVVKGCSPHRRRCGAEVKRQSVSRVINSKEQTGGMRNHQQRIVSGIQVDVPKYQPPPTKLWFGY